MKNSIGKGIATIGVWGAVVLAIWITKNSDVAWAFLLSTAATGAIWTGKFN